MIILYTMETVVYAIALCDIILFYNLIFYQHLLPLSTC